jgi:ABC-2 type transport system ATP-binding protein
MDTVAIHTHNLIRKFNTHRAVDRLTLDVPAGITFGLLGPKGAGKTTTIRLLLGLLPPTSGSARVLGYDVRTQATDIHAHTGALLQQEHLEDSLNAETILTSHEHSGVLPSHEQQSRSHALLTHFGLWVRRQEMVGTWTLELQRRLAIVQALLHRPDLLFLDEPTTGLDTAAATALRQTFADYMHKEGTTVFLATNSLVEAMQICDIVGILHQGRLLAVATPSELQARGAVRVEIRGRGFTPNLVALLGRRAHVMAAHSDGNYLSIDLLQDPRYNTHNYLDSAPLVTLLIESGAEVEEVHKQPISLEEFCSTLLTTPLPADTAWQYPAS